MKKLKNNLCILSILFLLEIFCISYAPAHATNTEDTEGSIQQSPHLGGGHVEVQDSPRKPQQGGTATETWVGSNNAPIEISPEEQEAANKAWEKYLEENCAEQMSRTLTGHEYKESGNYHAYVTVTYTGRYRINNGSWRPLPGQLTRTSEAALVRVWEIETHNVAKLCTEDPTAWACPGSKHRPDYNNPNPRLAVPDPHTGQQWHKDNAGSGDTEWWRKPAKKQTGSR